MENNRYFILDLQLDKPVVLPYQDEAQASFDFVRLGGLVNPKLILVKECEVSLRTDGKTLEYKKGDEHENI